MGNTNVRWFVCPGNIKTNEVVAERLPSQTTQLIRDRDGVERDVWECDWNGVIIPLIANHRELGLYFKIFRIRGRGKMERFPFPKPRRRKKVAVRNAAAGEAATF